MNSWLTVYELQVISFLRGIRDLQPSFFKGLCPPLFFCDCQRCRRGYRQRVLDAFNLAHSSALFSSRSMTCSFFHHSPMGEEAPLLRKRLNPGHLNRLHGIPPNASN